MTMLVVSGASAYAGRDRLSEPALQLALSKLPSTRWLTSCVPHWRFTAIVILTIYDALGIAYYDDSYWMTELW